MSLARRLTHIDNDLLAVQKRAINLGMELMGARTMQRLGAELDARAHLSVGPSKAAFSANVKDVGLREALRIRDKPFGDGMVHLGDVQKGS